MRYFYEPTKYHGPKGWRIHFCNHDIYNQCTLFVKNGKGIAVIQRHFMPKSKTFLWTRVDPPIANDIYAARGFNEFFEAHARRPEHDIYPTYDVRKLMWILKMKPLKKEFWEDY